ncbi:MAG: hypothetical protein O2967_06855 [Proteobacteria bacterium]|nr:hypothetical protein [Pseudomonadota bacterium]
MALGATSFLGSAAERLLPLSVPFRFFGAAVLFHVAAWATLVAGAGELATFRGGGGAVLAAIHLMTLGVFVMTAVGASLQLLPVATLQGFAAPARINAIWWLLNAGTICLAMGMYLRWHEIMAVGGALLTFAIGLYLWLLVGNLRRGGAMMAVVAHGWLAAGALIGLLVLGLVLIINTEHGFLANSQRAAVSHMLVAAYGFMGLLAMGFSYVLVPMFALAPMPSDKWALAAMFCACTGLALGFAGTWFAQDAWAALGGGIGLIGAAIYLSLMAIILKQRMRRKLGPAFDLMRLSWALLPLSLLAGTAWALNLLPDWGAVIFGLWLFGWILGFLLAILQRIVPFLASMHAAFAVKRRPPTVTALTARGPLAAHLYCHCAALVSLSAGIIWPIPFLVTLGAVAGLLGAASFAWFFLLAVLRYRTALRAPSA